MKLRLFQVDAFADRIFEGNPAAVIPLESWLPDDLLSSQSPLKTTSPKLLSLFLLDQDFD